jgi:hypothetical protein
MPTYKSADGSLMTPDTTKEKLHEYHADISAKVSCDVLGLTGDGPRIETIVLKEKCDIADLETYLNSELVLVDDL